MSVNLPYGLGGNYRHFRIDRRQIRGQYVVFLIQILSVRYYTWTDLGKLAHLYPARTIPLV